MITQSFGYFSFPGLSKIPVIGELFFAKPLCRFRSNFDCDFSLVCHL